MTPELIAALIAAVGTIIGGFFAAIRITMAPLKVVIENNTKALEKLDTKLDKHDERLDNHENRIVKIETVHELEDHK